jgi:phosphatidylserine/phosphatidylglycerophosphate/cardiolipin synthase-like enzyme
VSSAPIEIARGDAVLILQRGGVPLIDDTEDGSAGSGLMHSKFLVVDRSVVVSGSANFTPSCIHGDPDDPRTRGNVNHLLRIESGTLAARFVAEFDRFWGDGPGGAADSHFGLQKHEGGVETVMVGPTRVRLLFAPHRRSDPHNGLNLLGEVLSETKRRSRSRPVCLLSPESGGHPWPAQGPWGQDSPAGRPWLCQSPLLGKCLICSAWPCRIATASWKPATAPGCPLEGVAVPRLAGGDKLHHKVAVIDNRRVVTGSFNWSPSAAHQNDEVLMIIDSAQLAAHFTREIDRLWAGAELGIDQRLERKLARSRQLCGSGVQRV